MGKRVLCAWPGTVLLAGAALPLLRSGRRAEAPAAATQRRAPLPVGRPNPAGRQILARMLAVLGLAMLATGGPAVQASPAPSPDSGALPGGKLICTYLERRISFRPGEATQASRSFSNMGSLQLSDGRYVAGSGDQGRFQRRGDRIEFVSGTWAGALGRLEAGEKGEPMVVFRIEENRRPNGKALVDPDTTRCAEVR